MVEGWSGVDSVVKQYINGAGGGNGHGGGDGNVRSSAGNKRNSVAVYSGIRIRHAIQDVAKEDSDSSSGSSSSRSSGDQTNTMEQDPILQQYFGNCAYCLTGNDDNINHGSGIKRDTMRGCFIIFRNTFPLLQAYRQHE